MAEKLLTMKDIAKIMSWDPGTSYRLCKKGELKSVKIGKNRRVLQADFDQWLKNQTNPKKEA